MAALPAVLVLLKVRALSLMMSALPKEDEFALDHYINIRLFIKSCRSTLNCHNDWAFVLNATCL
jgi:hypothetical protein